MIDKIRTASTHVIHWQAPEPLAPDTTPTLTVRAGGAAVAGVPAMAVVAGPATISGVPSGGQRVLTASAAVATSERATLEAGEAFYVSDEDGTRPCRVRSISGVEITVTEPFTPVLHPGGVLQWRRWWAELGPDDATGEARRDMTWSVTYTPLYAGSADGTAASRTDGPHQFVVVDRPFDTRLDTARLHAALAELAQTVPARDADRSAVIELALDELVADMRAVLRPLGAWEDAVEGVDFRPAHTYLAASLVVERTDPDRARELRARYHSSLGSALRTAQIDLDLDGVPDEQPSRLSGAVDLRPRSLSSIVRSSSPAGLPRWTRDTHF